MSERNERPIGVFDSGLGGLTVAAAVQSALPNENLVYLGDTARVPYGSRSPQTILRYARACGRKLASENIKVLVVACNTVSAVALEMLRVELDIPVLGVIEPGARAGVAASHHKRIGVIATAGTVASGAYARAVSSVDSRAEIVAAAAPLLVPLVEEGWLEGDVPILAARRYLAPIAKANVDALILGCTHYPLLMDVIESELAILAEKPVPVVDSAHATANELAEFLAARASKNTSREPGSFKMLVTDYPARFTEVASRFLGQDAASLLVQQVDL